MRLRKKSPNSATTLGWRFDLHAMDALHVATALAVGAEEFITSLTSTFSGGFSAVSGCKVFVLSNRSSQGQNSDEYE